MKKFKVFCFDIVNTLCITKSNFYNKSKPIKNAIKTVNKLYNYGHKIIIFTARGMGKFNGNSLKVKKKYYKFTLKQLNKWGLKFHKLYIGKPSFDYIVDDKSIFYKKSWKKELIKFINE